ncbi:hypothetical protein NM208_g13052 [Fusarium decemcellulare]|uniref:Uncharacterized protein n=1 Tax=Fusarium decemcellulare TaxID=57161 RepID=A0ACC1RQL8_9HYPO|nr:hypothetical protein NM208_g13052 [Fusarium decemcellulare]
MLLNSNDEIQSLREQLLDHQPVPDSGASTLKAELESYMPPETPRISQAFHIHHHYHVGQKPENRKARRKRASWNHSTFASQTTSGTSTPRSSGRWSLNPGPAMPALASINTKEPSSVISMPKQRWSLLSEQPSEYSSLPSSPRATHRNSLFDSTFGDSDIPTSPTTSFDPMSPTWRAHRKGPSEISALSFQAPSLQLDPGTPPQSSRQHQFNDHIIHEEDEGEIEEVPSRTETPDLGPTPSIDESSIVESSEDSREDFMPRPRIHRAISHESIMSLAGGLDIHTLKARPSQLTLRPLGGAEAVVTGRSVSPSLSGLSATPQGSPSSSLGKWVGWRPWGASSTNTAPKPIEKDKERDLNRAPGINQPGSIPGFHQYWAAQRRKGAPSRVTTESVDRAALEEGLQE